MCQNQGSSTSVIHRTACRLHGLVLPKSEEGVVTGLQSGLNQDGCFT